ncbi:MAG: hypothetical protein NTU59_00255 [Coprothermobacterota bacterium]|nr:hypothetical protein [Coprothermobacterota bacterium]
MKEKLDQLWNEGIGGSDFFISAIGPALEILSRYAKEERFSGEEVAAKDRLELVRKTVSDYVLSRILHSGELEAIDPLTRFYVLWRWTYNELAVPFDEASELAAVVGVVLTDYWKPGGIVRKEKENLRLLGPKERDASLLKQERFETIADGLQVCLVLWEKGERKRISEIVVAHGWQSSHPFWLVAQALAEVLPAGDKKKQLLQGFLCGRESFSKSEDDAR